MSRPGTAALRHRALPQSVFLLQPFGRMAGVNRMARLAGMAETREAAIASIGALVLTMACAAPAIRSTLQRPLARSELAELLKILSLADVRWAAERWAPLTPQQWRAAFAAGGYDAARAARYIRKLKEKIAQGMNLSTRRSAERQTREILTAADGHVCARG